MALRIIATAKPQYAPLLKSLLDDEQLTLAATLTPVIKNLDRAGSVPADAIVLYSNMLDTEETDFLERLYMTRRKLIMILICDGYDAELMARAMHCGVSRVLSTSDGEDALIDMIIASVERERSRQETGGPTAFDSRVLAVFGTKGGTGKTTVAVNLAVALARTGKKTALLDLDLQFGDVDVFLDIAKADSIADVINEGDFKYTVLKSYLFTHKSGLHVLCAPSAPELAETVKPAHIDKTVASLRAEFDYLILDLPPAFNDCSLTALELCDSIYFITNPDISSLRNTKVCLGVLGTLGSASKVLIVLNKDGLSMISRKDVERILDMQAELILPCDQKSAMMAVNRGIPFVMSGHTKLSSAIEAYVKRLVSAKAK